MKDKKELLKRIASNMTIPVLREQRTEKKSYTYTKHDIRQAYINKLQKSKPSKSSFEYKALKSKYYWIYNDERLSWKSGYLLTHIIDKEDYSKEENGTYNINKLILASNLKLPIPYVSSCLRRLEKIGVLSYLDYNSEYYEFKISEQAKRYDDLVIYAMYLYKMVFDNMESGKYEKKTFNFKFPKPSNYRDCKTTIDVWEEIIERKRVVKPLFVGITLVGNGLGYTFFGKNVTNENITSYNPEIFGNNVYEYSFNILYSIYKRLINKRVELIKQEERYSEQKTLSDQEKLNTAISKEISKVRTDCAFRAMVLLLQYHIPKIKKQQTMLRRTNKPKSETVVPPPPVASPSSGFRRTNPKPITIIPEEKSNNVVVTKEGTTEGFFPKQVHEVSQNDTAQRKIVVKLANIVSDHFKISISSKRFGLWDTQIDNMKRIDGITYERINTALDWYKSHVGRQFVPDIESAKTLREKFLKLEMAMKRDCNGFDVDRKAQELRQLEYEQNKLTSVQLEQVDKFADFMEEHTKRQLTNTEILAIMRLIPEMEKFHSKLPVLDYPQMRALMERIGNFVDCMIAFVKEEYPEFTSLQPSMLVIGGKAWLKFEVWLKNQLQMKLNGQPLY